MKKIIVFITILIFLGLFLFPSKNNVYIDRKNHIEIHYPKYTKPFTENDGKQIMFKDNEEGPSYVTVILSEKESTNSVVINYWKGEDWIVRDNNLRFTN